MYLSHFPIQLIHFFSSAILIGPYFITAKAMAGDGKLQSKELIYMIVACLLNATFFLLDHNLSTTFFQYIFSTVPAFFFLYIYFYKVKSKSFQTSVAFSIFSLIVTLLIEVTLGTIQVYVFHLPIVFPNMIPFLVHAFSFYIVVVFSAHFLRKTPQKNLLANTRLQNIAAFISTLVFVSFLITINVQHFLGHSVSFLSFSSALMISYAFALLACFIFYAKALDASQTVARKEVAQRALLHYMTDSEQQQTAMRKFKHDYQNILTAMNGFFDEKDYSGLEIYYKEKVLAASQVIAKSDFALEGLSKIKPLEIRGLLTAKLTMAQNLGLNTRFEAIEEIEHIPVDSVSLVRILGIILDNAIEELQSLGSGKLIVSCFKDNGSILFIVQNTCRKNIEKLHELKQSGFSTKGSGRGLGLSNLADLVATHSEKLTLQTSVKEDKFIQKLWIGESA